MNFCVGKLPPRKDERFLPQKRDVCPAQILIYFSALAFIVLINSLIDVMDSNFHVFCYRLIYFLLFFFFLDAC